VERITEHIREVDSTKHVRVDTANKFTYDAYTASEVPDSGIAAVFQKGLI
jgi:hypothetical protein